MNLQEFFGEREAQAGARLGLVVSGSLVKGIEVKLDGSASVEDMAVGRYVVIEGQRKRFFGIITDVRLGALDEAITVVPPDVDDPFVAQVVQGTSTYGVLHVLPMLALDKDARGLTRGPQPVKTVPVHFTMVRQAADEDVARIFGEEDGEHFSIGTPLDMETKVCLNLSRFVERSNGIFGKSGTGKTFLTRLLLIGILQKGVAVNLVFDMHCEYGWRGSREGGGYVKGLKQLFPSRVAVFSLDEAHSRRRGISPDFVVRIGYGEIEPEDIAILRESLNLSEVAADAAYTLQRHFGSGRWLKEFLDLEKQEGIYELAKEIGSNEKALLTLHNRLGRFLRFHFMVADASEEAVGALVQYLERGVHVILEFGRYGDNLAAYILVANLLTRRIHQRWVERKDRAMGDRAQEPVQLVITIEEAHKFLNPQVAGQTTFGVIAREMRKYNVTLMVVDQRPSGIDEEVMSQIGTRVTCLLENEKDIDAVLAGVSGKSELTGVLAKLESKQQALIFGHAVPMPIVVRTREYGSTESYRELGDLGEAELKKQAEADVSEMYGSEEAP